MSHEWPGNVRSLMNVIERTVQLTQGDLIDKADLLFSDEGTAQTHSLPEPHEGFDVQAHLDERALEVLRGSASSAARLLNVTPQAVGKFMKASKPA
jgi:transcriptional regulator with PAS, ATPase and Fis domain